MGEYTTLDTINSIIAVNREIETRYFVKQLEL